MPTRPRAWRTLTDDELAAAPEARLGGAIAVLLGLAVVIVLPVIFGLIRGLPSLSAVATILREGLGGGRVAAYSVSGLVQFTFLILWAAAFIAATLTRAAWGPLLASVLFAICMLLGPLSTMTLLAAFAPGSAEALASTLTLVPNLILHLAAAVGFWAYMRDGARPNIYFRRQVRVP